MSRLFTVIGPDGIKCYNGFDGHAAGAWYRLRIGEAGPFYCGRELDLAVCELVRYGHDQWNWKPDEVPVRVHVLPGHHLMG